MIFLPLGMGAKTSLVPCHLIIMHYNYKLYSFSWTACTHYAIHYCSIEESCVISSRTTTFHHSPLCEHTLHFLHLQAPHLPQESCACRAIFYWINNEPDPHRYTLRTLSTSSQQPVKAHLLVSAPISVWSFPANLLPTSSLRVRGAACQRRSVSPFAHVVSFSD